MGNKYKRKNRKKLKWFDPFNRNKPLEIFADSDEEMPSNVSGVSKRKARRPQISLEQQVPRDFKLFMRDIKIHAAEGSDSKADERKLLVNSNGKTSKLINSTMKTNEELEKKNEQTKSRKKMSASQQLRNQMKEDKKEDQEIDDEEKEYFKDKVELHERVDGPPQDLKAPLATLRLPRNYQSPELQTPKTKLKMLTPKSAKMKELSLSAKKILSDVKSKKKSLGSITKVKPAGANFNDDMSAERARVVSAYRELKLIRNKNFVLRRPGSQKILTPVEI